MRDGNIIILKAKGVEPKGILGTAVHTMFNFIVSDYIHVGLQFRRFISSYVMVNLCTLKDNGVTP